MIIKTYVPDINVLKIVRSGDIKLDELIELITELSERFKGVSVLRILEDIRLSETKFSTTEYPKLAVAINQGMSGFIDVRHAQLVEDQKHTALSLFYEEEISKVIENYSFRTFSTEKAAYNWLKS